MKRIKYFFADRFNLLFTIASVFVLLDMKFNFFNKEKEFSVSNLLDDFLVKTGIALWIGITVTLIVWSTLSYNKENKKW